MFCTERSLSRWFLSQTLGRYRPPSLIASFTPLFTSFWFAIKKLSSLNIDGGRYELPRVWHMRKAPQLEMFDWVYFRGDSLPVDPLQKLRFPNISSSNKVLFIWTFYKSVTLKLIGQSCLLDNSLWWCPLPLSNVVLYANIPQCWFPVICCKKITALFFLSWFQWTVERRNLNHVKLGYCQIKSNKESFSH